MDDDEADAVTQASWQLDPTGRHHLRFWDGLKWTDHVADRGVESLDAVADDEVRSLGGDERPAMVPPGEWTKVNHKNEPVPTKLAPWLKVVLPVLLLAGIGVALIATHVQARSDAWSAADQATFQTECQSTAGQAVIPFDRQTFCDCILTGLEGRGLHLAQWEVESAAPNGDDPEHIYPLAQSCLKKVDG